MSPVRRIAQHFQQTDLQAVGRAIALSALVGVVAGAGAIIFQVLCLGFVRIFLDGIAGFRPFGPAGEQSLYAPGTAPFRPWLLALVPAVGGLLSGLLVQRFAPEAAGHGTDEAIDAFHRRRGVIRGRVPFVKTLASAMTIGSGGSGGREGPIAQIGAGFGSFLATRLGLSERDRRILLAAGVGAGVGSIFRAPLAGALFAAEVLYSDPEFESDVIIPAAMATIVAYCVFSLKFGFGALFSTPRFTFHSAWELVPYTALALIVALAAGAFVQLFYGTHRLFKGLSVPPALRPMVGGLATGLLGVLVYFLFRDARALDILSFGYGSIQQALNGEIPLTILLVLAGGKMLTTSLSIGSGGSGGVFGPSMVIGGALGGAVGILAQRLMPEVVTQPGAFVVVGMAGFFSAAANTPISTLVMVSEMTGNYQLLLPALWVCSLSYLFGRHWTLYRSQVSSRVASPAHRGAIMSGVLRSLRARDVVRAQPPLTLPESASLPEIIHTVTLSNQHCFPVMDANERMTGVVTVAQIRQFLDERDSDLPVIAYDMATRAPLSVSMDDDLDTVLQRLIALDMEELPVTDTEDRQKLVGLISRRDVTAAYSRRRLEGDGPPSAFG